MHGTSSLTNRTQPSFLTSNPLQTTTQQKHEQFPLLVARVHKPSPRGGPLCATAAGRGKRASALTGRAASRSASFHPSGKWSSTPTAGEAERVLAQGPRPLQCACKRACRAADLCFLCIPTRTTERVLRPATWLAVALPRPSPRPALACSAPHGAAPPPHSHVRGLSCLLAESGANPFLPPEPAPGPASPLCSRPPSVPRAPPARPPTSVCRCARVPAVHWRGRRRGSASGAARAKGGPHASWAGFRHFADDYRACVVSVVRVCLLVGAWSVGFFSEVSGGRLLVCGLFWLRGGGGGGGVVFMICLVW